MKLTVAQIVEMAEKRMHNDYHIHAGVERRVSTKVWEKGDKHRTYITIQCFSAAGNFKGSYKCGYVDMVSGEYVTTQYDDIDLTSEYRTELYGEKINPLDDFVKVETVEVETVETVETVEAEAETSNYNEVEMHYSEYKNNYSNCETKAGSYNKKIKTIIVLVPVKEDTEEISAEETAEEEAIRELCEVQNIDKNHPQYERYVEMCKNTLAKSVDEIVKQYNTLSPNADEAKKAKGQKVIEIVKKYKNAISKAN